MQTSPELSTLTYYPKHDARHRTFSLYYFSSLLLLWTLLGHTVLGFEQSWLQPFLAVFLACGTQVLLEWLDARATNRQPRYASGFGSSIVMLLPALITGLAIGMLLFAGGQIMPIVFASVLSIASKVIFRAPIGNSTQHIFNPSNFGITATLLLFPWVAVAPPYHFTGHVTGFWNWFIPSLILLTGIFLHARSTYRLPLILSWIIGFICQGMLRHFLYGVTWFVQLLPMTSAGFIVFTLYMIPDPATTPIKTRWQILFGFSVAATYGLLVALHVPYGLFLALTAISTVRGIGLYLLKYAPKLLPTQ